MQPCSKKAQHTAQETSGSYYSRTKPKEQTRASLFHSISVIIFLLLDKTCACRLSFVNDNTTYNVVVCSPEQSIVSVTIAHSSLLNTLKWDLMKYSTVQVLK